MSTQALPVAVGRTRQHASDVFGPAFDALLLSTYDDRADDPAGFVGVAADPDMGEALGWALGLLAIDPALEVGVELPRDPAVSALVEQGLAGAAVRVVGVRRYGAHAVVVLAPGAGEPERLAGLLAAAVRDPATLATDLERTRESWELAAHRERSDHLERQIRDVRVQLARKRGESRDLHVLAEQHGLVPVPAARARQHRAAIEQIEQAAGHGTVHVALPERVGALLGAGGRRGRALGLGLLGGLGLVGLLALVLVVVLLAGGGAVRAALALALLVLLALLGLGGLVLGLTRAALEPVAESRAAEVDLVDRLGALEQLHADLVAAVADRLEPVAAEPVDLDGLGDRVQALATLYALAPPRADVPRMAAADLDLATQAVAALVDRAPALVVVTGAPRVALFLGLAARRHELPTRVVALDEDAERVRELVALAGRHGVGDVVEARHAPLGRSGVTGHRTGWYAAAAWDDLHDVGLLVVGGPADAIGPGARVPSAPLLGDRLAGRGTVLLPHASADLLTAWVDALGVGADEVAPDVHALRRG